MNFTGIDYVNKTRITNIMKAIDLGDVPTLYSALRGSDDSLRDAFARFLILNPVEGWNRAVQILGAPLDAMNAVRTAAVCLLMTRIAAKAQNDV